MRLQRTTLAAYGQRHLSVRMEVSTVARLAELAAERGITVSTAVRIAVSRYVMAGASNEEALGNG